MRLRWALAWLVLCAVVCVRAGTVQCGGPVCDFSVLLNYARNNATANEVINLAVGTFTGSCGTPAQFKVPGLTLVGSPRTVIDCALTGAPLYFTTQSTTLNIINIDIVRSAVGPAVIVDSGGVSATFNLINSSFTATNGSLLQINLESGTATLDGVNAVNSASKPYKITGAPVIVQSTGSFFVRNSVFRGGSWGNPIALFSLEYDAEIESVAFSNVTFCDNTYAVVNAGLNAPTLNIINSNFVDNTLSSLYAESALFSGTYLQPTVTGTNFTDNYLGNNYIFQNMSGFTMTASNVIGNSASKAAIIKVSSGVFTNSYFAFNGVHQASGGALVAIAGGKAGVSLIGCTFFNNSASIDGGAVYATSNGLTVTNTNFISNSAARFGGGLCYGGPGDLSSVVISGGSFTDNQAGCGGGMYLDVDGTLQISNVEVSHNVVSNDGGGIFLSGNSGNVSSRGPMHPMNAWQRVVLRSVTSTITISGGNIEGNTCGNTGGGIAVIGPLSAFLLEDVMVTANTAEQSGGGLMFHPFASNRMGIVSGSYFKYNSAPQGGGIYIMSGDFTISNYTYFSANQASTSGAALYCTNAFLTGDPTSVSVGQPGLTTTAFECGDCGCCNSSASTTLFECLLLPKVPCYYKCPLGFSNLQLGVMCQSNNTLSAAPICLTVDCPAPVLPRHTVATSGSCSGTLGAECHLQCETGYRPVSEVPATVGLCQASNVGPAGIAFVGQNLECEKATSDATVAVIVTLGVALALVTGGAVIFFVRRRRQRAAYTPIGSDGGGTTQRYTNANTVAMDMTRPSGDATVGGPASASRSGGGGGGGNVSNLSGSIGGGTSGRGTYSIDAGALTQVPWEDLVVAGSLGSGGFGAVYRVTQKSTRTDMALKIARNITTHEQMQAFISECNVHAGLRHPHCITLLGVAVSASEVGMLMPLMAGDLRSLAPAMTVERKRQALLGAARGLAYLHAQGIIHADIKPQNILVDGLGTAQLADFGLSGVTAQQGYTELYAAPEVLRGGAHTRPSDVYSLGVVIVEILSGKRPFAHQPGRRRDSPDVLPFPLTVMGEALGQTAALEAAVMHALNDDASRRPQAVELIDALA